MHSAIALPSRFNEDDFELDEEAEIYIDDDDIIIDFDPETPDEEIVIFDEPAPRAMQAAQVLDEADDMIDAQPVTLAIAPTRRPKPSTKDLAPAPAPLERTLPAEKDATKAITATPVTFDEPAQPKPAAVTRTQRVQTIDPFAM